MAKPGSITEYIRDRQLLPAAEIDRLVAATPTAPLTQRDFVRLGFSSWAGWLNSICTPVRDSGTDPQLLLAIM
jgi:hypothetical protein